MFIKEIWRYPVKSLAGERLDEAKVTANGIDGDRVVQVYGGRGRIATARTFPGLLGLKARTGSGGEILVNGRPWNDPAVVEAIQEIVGPQSVLARNEDPRRFDILPLLVATDGAIAEFDRDSRRLRPNIIVGGVEGLAERDWQGRKLRVGDVEIGLHDLRGRCVMTTYDPDTQVQDHDVLKDIVKRFDGTLALNAEVLKDGRIAVGMEVELH